MSGPLEGIKVLDLSRVLAGPWAAQLLGDYGANVVKVERPGKGDDTRRWGPPWVGGSRGDAAYFHAANRNKRSIAVDLANGRGRDLVRKLAATADVVIENFRVGTMGRFGLGAKSLLASNPRLVFCSISAFGQSGSRAKEPGYDAMVQAEGGLMSITGPADEDGGSPQKVGVAIADIMAGMYAVTAILAALEERHRSGRGQVVDVPLYDSQVGWLANQAMNYLIGGRSPVRQGTAHPNLVPYQAFATSDGHFVLAVGSDAQFAACVGCLGLPGLAVDPRYADNAARVGNRDSLVNLLAAEFRKNSTEFWLRRLESAEVPAGPINTVGEVLSNAYAKERSLVRSLPHPLNEALPTVSNPVRFSRTPVRYDLAPPLLGVHATSVLNDWLGYSAQQIDELASAGAIGPGHREER